MGSFSMTAVRGRGLCLIATPTSNARQSVLWLRTWSDASADGCGHKLAAGTSNFKFQICNSYVRHLHQSLPSVPESKIENRKCAIPMKSTSRSSPGLNLSLSATAEVTTCNSPRSGSIGWSATGVAPTGAGLPNQQFAAPVVRLGPSRRAAGGLGGRGDSS